MKLMKALSTQDFIIQTAPFTMSNCSDSHNHPMGDFSWRKGHLFPTSYLLEKMSPFLHQLFLFTGAIFGIGWNSLQKATIVYKHTVHLMTESEKNE